MKNHILMLLTIVLKYSIKETPLKKQKRMLKMQKKILSIVAVITVLLTVISCSDAAFETAYQEDASSINKEQSIVSTAAMVELVKAYTSASSYHGSGGNTRSFIIKVKNAGFEKQVVIHHSINTLGPWVDLTADYVGPAETGYEIWALNDYRSFSYADEILGKEFVVKYVVNGQTYWDNNAGKNYSMGYLDGTYLNPNLNVLQAGASFYGVGTSPSTFYVNADVRNIGYNKTVKVVYSFDNWATTYTENLKFADFYQVGYSQFVESPNVHNIERWRKSITVPADVENLEYAIAYDVNGSTQWDNNYGNNYKMVKTQY
ncbi:MAG TPA: endonuclease [Spirochaetia bacterium]|nr:endonuclease [Spirochaetia bacterium]